MYRLLLILLVTSIASVFSSSFTRPHQPMHPSPSPLLGKRRFKQSIGNYRCVLNIYKEDQISEAVDEACKYINSGKKTWGLSRWPKHYQPRFRQQFSFYSNTFRIWPLRPDGKQFRGGFILNTNNLIVLDGNCHFAGVVVLFKLKPEFTGPCPIIGCHAPDILEYKNCELLEPDNNKPLRSNVRIEERPVTSGNKTVAAKPKKEPEERNTTQERVADGKDDQYEDDDDYEDKDEDEV